MRQLILMLILAVLFGGVTSSRAEIDQYHLSEVELQQFLIDGPKFLSWAKANNQPDIIFQLMETPAAIGQFSSAQEVIAASGWLPGRFANVLHQLVVCYKMQGMGGSSQELVRKLENTRQKMSNDTRLAPAERQQQLAQIDRCIRDARLTESQYKDISVSELLLINKYRSQLKRVFDGNIPLRPIMMPSD